MLKSLKKLRGMFYRRTGDRRKFPRVPLSVKVTNLATGVFQYYHCANISVGGMFLKANEPPALGTRLRIKFGMPEREIEAEAEVVRHQEAEVFPAGMGIKFVRLAEADRRAIAEYVAQVV